MSPCFPEKPWRLSTAIACIVRRITATRIKFLAAALSVCVITTPAAFSEQQHRDTPLVEPARIVVDAAHIIGPVNRRVLGSNALAHSHPSAANYGNGFWDPHKSTSAAEPARLAQAAGISMLRFPGGCGTHHYDWKQAIGRRRHFLFGVNEFMRLCRDIGSEAIITVSYFTGTAADAADLVSYLNSPAIRTDPWARQRQQSGSAAPFGVTYFEIGNEVWHGDHAGIKSVAPEQYARDYLRYYAAMKAVDPTIKIGVVLHEQSWNERVMAIVGDRLDFGVLHIYPSPIVPVESIADYDAATIFLPLWAKPRLGSEPLLRQTAALLANTAGRPVGIAVTEYNAFFVQDQPVPYRHSLGTALLNAELLRIFMKPSNKVLLATHWNFVNEYWGSIANGFDGTSLRLHNPYYKRPNYFVFELYQHCFGDFLIKSDVECGGYDITRFAPLRRVVEENQNGTAAAVIPLPDHWSITPREGIAAGQKHGVLSIEFIAPRQFNYYHAAKQVAVEPATYYRLSGYIRAVELAAAGGVCLEIQDARGWEQTRSAAATAAVAGTSDWRYVQTIYKTRPDAAAARIYARRIGEQGPLRGTAAFAAVTLERFIPSLPERIPYLAVNAAKSADGKHVYLIVINKNIAADQKARVRVDNFPAAATAAVRYLWAKTVDATNERSPHNAVRLYRDTAVITGNEFEYSFKKHSLTAMVFSAASE